MSQTQSRTEFYFLALIDNLNMQQLTTFYNPPLWPQTPLAIHINYKTNLSSPFDLHWTWTELVNWSRVWQKNLISYL